MTQPNIADVESRLRKLALGQGFNKRISVRDVPGTESICAYILLNSGDINLEIDLGWDPASQYSHIKEFADKHIKKQNIHPGLKVLEDVIFHEIGHHKLRNDAQGLGCPINVDYGVITLDAVSRVLKAHNVYSAQGRDMLENLICDIIDNLNASKYSSYNGICVFLAEQAELNGHKYSNLYDAFVRLNMELWGNKKQKKFLSEYYTNNPDIDTAVQNCMNKLGLTGTKDNNVRILFDKDRWFDIFTAFAEELVQFMDEPCPETLPGSGSGGASYSPPQPGGESQDPADGTQSPSQPGIPSHQPGTQSPSQPGGQDTLPPGYSDAMSDEIMDPDNLKRILRKRADAGEDIPAFIEDWQALDYLYQSYASDLHIKIESIKKGMSLPIAPVGHREFDKDKDRLDDIVFGKILFNDEGQPVLAVPRSQIETTGKYKVSLQKYPDLNIAVLDESISMKGAANINGIGNTSMIPWGDNSIYHYAVLTYYSIVKSLHALQIATTMNYNLLTFSSSTSATGEKPHESLYEIKRRILEPRFGHSTSLDIAVLGRHASEPGSMLMTISDGEIYNWDSIKDDFKRIISDKSYVHFQIGPESNTSKELKEWGALVVEISDASEMPQHGVDITKNFYRNYAARQVAKDGRF
jgi:hypothetical protein